MPPKRRLSDEERRKNHLVHSKNWKVRHAEQDAETKKRWMANNKDKVKAARAKRADVHREECKAWRLKNPERYKELSKRSAEKMKNEPWRVYIKNAKARQLSWGITNAFAEMLMQQPCHYCGQVGTPFVGIDRKDNDEGYFEENVVPACKRCNWAKGTSTYEEFQAWLNQVAEFIVKKDMRK